jgi:hypothetical protein
MKKLLLLLFFIIFTSSFAQQKEKNNSTPKIEINSTISNITAYPNPFSESTIISFTSQKEQSVEFSLKNLLGKTIFNQTHNAKKGLNSFTFKRNEFVRGIYIYTLQTQDEVISKRLIIR